MKTECENWKEWKGQKWSCVVEKEDNVGGEKVRETDSSQTRWRGGRAVRLPRVTRGG